MTRLRSGGRDKGEKVRHVEKRDQLTHPTRHWKINEGRRKGAVIMRTRKKKKEKKVMMKKTPKK